MRSCLQRGGRQTREKEGGKGGGEADRGGIEVGGRWK